MKAKLSTRWAVVLSCMLMAFGVFGVSGLQAASEESFYASQLRKAAEEQAAREAEYNAYQEALADFQASQIQKGLEEQAAREAEYNAYQERMFALPDAEKEQAVSPVAALQQQADAQMAIAQAAATEAAVQMAAAQSAQYAATQAAAVQTALAVQQQEAQLAATQALQATVNQSVAAQSAQLEASRSIAVQTYEKAQDAATQAAWSVMAARLMQYQAAQNEALARNRQEMADRAAQIREMEALRWEAFGGEEVITIHFE